MRRLIPDEPLAQSALWSRRLAIFAWATAALSFALSRAGAADSFAALAVFGAALVVAFVAALLAGAAASIIWRTGAKGAGQTALALFLALGLIAYPAYMAALAFVLPPIHDISTDLDTPPAFMISAKARAARQGRTPPPATAETIAAQREAYPEVQPALVDMEAAQAYQLCLRVAGDLGWKIVDANPPNLRGDGVAHIEATERSLFFGFTDDIAIRVRPLANQTRIDVRSVSRVGQHDFGKNARRVEKFIAEVQSASQER
jgi:uncharacterized protein (DUF1499 family)